MRSTHRCLQACPHGTCNCGRVQLLEYADNGLPIPRLPSGGKRLPERMENLQSLGDLEKLQQRMHEQLGIRLAVAPGVNKVRSMRGIRIEIDALPRLYRKTRQALPTAIRRGLENTRRSFPPCLTPMTCFGIFEGQGKVVEGVDRERGGHNG